MNGAPNLSPVTKWVEFNNKMDWGGPVTSNEVMGRSLAAPVTPNLYFTSSQALHELAKSNNSQESI